MVYRAAAGGRVQLQLIREDTETCRIALHFEQLHDRSCTMGRKRDFVQEIRLPFVVGRKMHRCGIVHHQLTAKIGLLLVAFSEQLIGSAVELPVDVTRWFTGIVNAVLGKLHRESVKGAFVKARNEPLHHLSGDEFKLAELTEILLL